MKWQPIGTADKYGDPILLYAHELLDADFNPRGVEIGHWCDDIGWRIPKWNNDQDIWEAYVIHPTHWMEIPTTTFISD